MLSLVVLFVLPCAVAQNTYVLGCLQIGNKLECSYKNFYTLPAFPNWIKVTTLQLFLRNIPHLDLSQAKWVEWPNLYEIYLQSKI